METKCEKSHNGGWLDLRLHNMALQIWFLVSGFIKVASTMPVLDTKDMTKS